MGRKTIYVDRSRIEAFQRCPRKRFNEYHMLGTGIRKDTINLDILIGVSVHRGLETLFKEGNVDLAVENALAEFMEGIKGSSFDQAEFADVDMTSKEDLEAQGIYLPEMDRISAADSAVAYLVTENKALVELLIRAFAKAPQGLARLLSEYDVLEVEQEDILPLTESADYELKMMAKADALLRRKLDGSLVVLSTKTTKSWDQRKENSAISDMQGMSEVYAIQARTGQPIEGVQMLYLLTSERRADKDGFKKRTGGVVRPWVSRMVDGSVKFAFASSWVDGEGKNRRLGKDWSRLGCWELGMTIEEYVDLLAEMFDEDLNDCPLNLLLINIPVVRRDQQYMDRWFNEVRAQEIRIANAMGSPMWNEKKDLPVIFPHHSVSCTYPTKCTFFDLCWNGGYFESDPLGSGFTRRKPHHEPEVEQFKEKENV